MEKEDDSKVAFQEGGMPEPHLSRELFQASMRGEVSEKEILWIAKSHFARLCPICDAAIDEARREVRQPGMGEYRSSLLVQFLVERYATRVRWETEKAAKDVKDLLRYDRDTRLRKVNRGRTRFRGAGAARLLIAEGERLLATDPAEATHLADLAYRVLLRGPYCILDYATLSLAFAIKGRGHTILNEPEEALTAYRVVKELVWRWDDPDPEVIARLRGHGALAPDPDPEYDKDYEKLIEGRIEGKETGEKAPEDSELSRG